MITGAQVEQARKLLGWSDATLARTVHKAVLTVSRVEARYAEPRVSATRLNKR